jgi:2'-5' RNA ligase
MSQFRGFIAIEIPASSSIIELEKTIKQTGADVKLVEPKNLHITLKFLGDTPEDKTAAIEQVIKKSVEGIKPFTIQLVGTGVFPNQNYIRVIWIGIEDGQILATIASDIDEQLSQIGFKKEQRRFSSHLTVGRVKTARKKNELVKVIEQYTTVEFDRITVDAIKLKQSTLTPQGPIYQTITEVKL